MCRYVLLALMTLAACAAAEGTETGEDAMSEYQALLQSSWKEVFNDPGTGDWNEKWFLDGEKATVKNTKEGLELRAGPTAREDACHAVLWTREAFEGDLKIEYEFTRLDEAVEFVVILYVQATGSGKGPYVEDLAAWSALRKVPAMSIYFNHLNTYHVSYAAFEHGNTDRANDYIRARRYLPESGQGLKGTDLDPSYDHTGLFAKGVPHKMTVIKEGQRLFLHVAGPEKAMLCHWDNRDLPPVAAGRVGLRHMYTRDARYRDLRISVRPEED